MVRPSTSRPPAGPRFRPEPAGRRYRHPELIHTPLWLGLRSFACRTSCPISSVLGMYEANAIPQFDAGIFELCAKKKMNRLMQKEISDKILMLQTLRWNSLVCSRCLCYRFSSKRRLSRLEEPTPNILQNRPRSLPHDSVGVKREQIGVCYGVSVPLRAHPQLVLRHPDHRGER